MKEKAEGSLLRARFKLMLNEPYLAAAIARLPLADASEKEWCKLIATDGYYIYYDAPAIEEVDPRHLPFLIAHETMHCVLGHIDRRGSRERTVWNHAVDYATNLMLVQLGLVMPPFGLIERKYRGLTAEEIYEALRGEDESQRDGDGASFPDLHVYPEDLEGADQREIEFPSLVERMRLQRSLVEPLEKYMRGSLPGSSVSELRAAKRSEIPWQVLLARFVTGLQTSDYRLWPPNRKHVWRGLYLPSVGQPGPSLLVAAIDTSGSMSNADISKILAELDSLRSATECQLVVLQCDATIQSIERFEPWDEPKFVRASGGGYQIQGRGGTDFKPVFEWLNSKESELPQEPDALIYCTDGYGSFPEAAPNCPVMWIVTHRGAVHFPFGDVINVRE